MRYLKYWTWLVVVAVLAACGGGGNPGSTSSGTTTTTTGKSTLTLTLVNAAGVTLTVNSISKSSNFYANAVVADANGTVLANQLVTFSTDYAVATLAGSTANATALTDSNGVAKVLISPLNLTTVGAAILSATTSVSSVTTSSSLNFSTAASNVTLGNLVATASSIGALESTGVTVVGAVAGAPASGVQVTFSASCGSFSPTSASTNGNGVASSTFQSDISCGTAGVATLTASATGASDVVKTITVTAAKAANVVFTSASPALMYVSSAPSGAKTSTVKFQVLDSSATGMAAQSVVFSLSSAAIASGVTFSLSGSASTTPQTVTTDSSGFASIMVKAGTLPTPVTVTGTVTLSSGGTVSASSSKLVVTTGAATQDRSSLSATKLSIEALGVDGVTTDLTMRVSDRLSNPVPDGTVVNFVASAGLVTGSCTTVSSACTVTYTSQGTRPVNGRVAILAYLDGEETFVDLNGDNIWQPGETFHDIGKAYIDLNEDNVWQSGEQIIDTSTNSSACVNSVYTTFAPSIASTCDGTWSSAIRVRQQTIVTLATSDARIIGVTPDASALGFNVGATRTVDDFWVWVHDGNANANLNGNNGLFNAMPTGTTITAAVKTIGVNCSVSSVSPNVVRNSSKGDLHQIVLNGDASCTSLGGTITVRTITTAGTVSSPGTITTITTHTDNATGLSSQTTSQVAATIGTTASDITTTSQVGPTTIAVTATAPSGFSTTVNFTP